jgi:UrcA family protein
VVLIGCRPEPGFLPASLGASIMATLVPRIVASLALSSAMLSVQANAMPADGPPSVTVSYRDLDLASASGERVLRRRVQYAAEDVCGVADPRNLSAMRPILACRKEAMAKAVPQVEIALAAARSGKAYAANDMRIGGAAF